MRQIILNVFFIVSITMLFSCNDDHEHPVSYTEIAGTYYLVGATSIYPIDYNNNGKFETNIFPYISRQSCISSVELKRNGEVIWNYLDFFGGSDTRTTCRVNDGIHGINPEKYILISRKDNRLRLKNLFDDTYFWQIENEKIIIRKQEPISVNYLFDGEVYFSKYVDSPGERIVFTYTFERK